MVRSASNNRIAMTLFVAILLILGIGTTWLLYDDEVPTASPKEDKLPVRRIPQDPTPKSDSQTSPRATPRIMPGGFRFKCDWKSWDGSPGGDWWEEGNCRKTGEFNVYINR